MGNRHALSPDQLLQLLGTRTAPRIIDVCIPEDHAEDPRFIPGALQRGHQTAAESVGNTNQTYVIVCQKGLKLSQGVAALLRAQGTDAKFLDGGMVDWAARSLPLWPADAHAALGKHATRWVLPFEMTPQEMWAAWMVTRFVDPEPVWMFVDAAQRGLVQEKFAAHHPSELADAVLETTGLWQSDLRTLRDQCLSGAVAQVLNGACKISECASEGVAQCLIVFDGLWAQRSGAGT